MFHWLSDLQSVPLYTPYVRATLHQGRYEEKEIIVITAD